MNIKDFENLPLDKKMEALNKLYKKEEKLTDKSKVDDLFGILFKNKKND
jgi:hypothetical protein